MEHFEKVVVGLILFIVTSVLAYLFKMRQLYAATPKLYRSTPLSNNGSLCELIVYNKGNQVEEDISVSLDPDLKAELLASNSPELTLENSYIKIERLHKGQEISAILLIENGIFDSSKITSISSKSTLGKVFKKTEEVPPNFAMSFLLIACLLGLTPGFIYGMKTYESLSRMYNENQLSAVYGLGWKNLERYYESDLRKSYSNQEFPVRLIGSSLGKEEAKLLNFEVYNKGSIPLRVTVDKKIRNKSDLSYFTNITVAPMSKKEFTIKAPDPTENSARLEYDFSLSYGDEFIYGITYPYIPTF